MGNSRNRIAARYQIGRDRDLILKVLNLLGDT